MSHEVVEKNIGLLAILVILVISVGGLVEIVPLGDWGRVIAEFWADGPDSETPPGHWNTLANAVVDHPEFEPRLAGRVVQQVETRGKAMLIHFDNSLSIYSHNQL